MTVKVGRRWKYNDSSPRYNFVGEVTKVDSSGRFEVKVVSYAPEAESLHKGQVYPNQYESNWIYLPGQDAP